MSFVDASRSVLTKCQYALDSHSPLPGNCGAGERRTTMLRVWQVLSKVLAGVGGLPAAARTQRTEALLAGARK